MADTTAPSPLHGVHPPLLFGRERERALLREQLAASLAGRGGLVLIGGEAGIGKTALAEALLHDAAARGALVLVGRCYDLSETPPYGPWTEALAWLPTDHGGAPLPAPLGDGEAPTSQAALFARVRDALAAAAGRRPLVLLLDDLHWADPASLDLLRHLARQLGALPLLLLATYREEAVTASHPLYQLLPLLAREARAARLALRPLGEADARALVRAGYRLPAADESRLVAHLQAHAEGNPLYLGELLRGLEEAGLLRAEGDGAALGDLGRAGLPTFLRQVIGARVARLGEGAQRLLQVAAVIGQEVPLELWIAVAEAAEDAVLALAERAVDARILAETPDGGGVRFAHALIRAALYEGTPAIRRRRLHRAAGAALAATPSPDPDAVAYHLRQAGDPRVGEWLVRAGERARGAYAWLTAAERYEAALALPEGPGGNPTQRALLLLTLAQLRRYHDPGRGIPLTEEAERLAAAAGDDVLAAAARFDRGHLTGLAGDHRAGLVEMEGAWPHLAGLAPHERARLPTLVVQGVAPGEDYHRGVLTLWLAAAGHYRAALQHGEPFARRAPGTTARGLQGLGLASAMLGQSDEIWRAYADSRAAYLAAGQHREVANTLNQELTWAVHYRGDEPVYLARLAEESERASVRASGVLAGLSPRLPSMPLFWLAGRWAEAGAVALEAAAGGKGNPWIYPRPWLGLILRAQGERERAGLLVREALPGGPTGDPATEFPQALALRRLAAGLALDAGDLPAARAWLEAHDRWLAWSGAVLGRAEGQLGWATYHRAAGDLAAAHRHAGQALAHAAEPRQPLALLAAHRTLGELATGAGRHAEAHLAEALALAEACAAPYERALTLLALAELRAASAEREQARAALDEARATLTTLEARPALARADALDARLAAPSPAPPAALPFGLTAREVEVLRLLAEGLPDARIAERLFISVPTVKAHLRSIYGKLGVPSRSAATRVALEHRLA